MEKQPFDWLPVETQVAIVASEFLAVFHLLVAFLLGSGVTYGAAMAKSGASAKGTPVRVARDGAKVLDCLSLGAAVGGANRPVPDPILLDLNMPKIGGLELLSRIRREERLRFIPIVVLSSSSQDGDMRES